jgi:MFS family permease
VQRVRLVASTPPAGPRYTIPDDSFDIPERRPHGRRRYCAPSGRPLDDLSSAAQGPAAPKSYAALSYPNYRLWFAGQLVSLFGTWMQTTAQGYLVYELTHSPAFLGYVGFASGIAMWMFALWGGVVADRVPRRTMLVITQAAAMVLAFVLAALAFAHVVQPWHIIVLAFGLGVVNAFDAPARQSFLLEMVERKDLTNAIALNATMFNAATALGPAFSGIFYAAVGPAWCFAINGVSFVAIIVALLAMRLAPRPPVPSHGSALANVAQGFAAVGSNRLIVAIMALAASMSVFGMSFTTLMPAWAVHVLGGDARTNGLLQSARGLGAMAAAFAMASIGRFDFRGKLLTVATFVFPLLLIAFSFTRHLGFSLAVLVVVGAANITVMNLCNSLVQTLTSDEVRGRVMSIYTLAFFGSMPIGALLTGAVAERMGSPFTIATTSVLALAFAGAIAVLVPRLRRMQ